MIILYVLVKIVFVSVCVGFGCLLCLLIYFLFIVNYSFYFSVLEYRYVGRLEVGFFVRS